MASKQSPRPPALPHPGLHAKVTSGSVGQLNTDSLRIILTLTVASAWCLGRLYDLLGRQSPGLLVRPALGCKDRNSAGARAIFPNYPGQDRQVSIATPMPPAPARRIQGCQVGEQKCYYQNDKMS